MSTPTFMEWPKAVATKVSGLIFLIGVVVVVGWALDITAFKSVLPGSTKMSPLTAIAFALAGVSLWTAATQVPRPIDPPPKDTWGVARRRLSQSCACVVALIGLLRLGDYLLGWNLDLDRLGFHETPGAAGVSTQTRMAPATAFSFFVVGCALWLVNRPRFIGAFQFLALLAGLVGWLGFSHYLYGGEPLLLYAKMSVHRGGHWPGRRRGHRDEHRVGPHRGID